MTRKMDRGRGETAQVLSLLQQTSPCERHATSRNSGQDVGTSKVLVLEGVEKVVSGEEEKLYFFMQGGKKWTKLSGGQLENHLGKKKTGSGQKTRGTKGSKRSPR